MALIATVLLTSLLGANIANLSLVMGGVALMMGAIPTIGDYWRLELAATFLASVMPILLMMDGDLSRWDGVILLVIYFIYVKVLVINRKKRKLAKMGIKISRVITRLVLQATAIGAVVVVVIKFGNVFSLSPTMFGLVLFAPVVVLPEVLDFFPGVTKKKKAVVLTNLLSSVVTNATLLIGLVAFVNPVKIENISDYALANLAFVLIFGLFWMFTATKRKLERWEGLILMGLYLTFVGLILLSHSI
jgi:cation:H+ antiporter